jgi:hypothetical protein
LFGLDTENTNIETLLEVLLGQQRNYLPIDEPQDKALCRTLVANTFPTTLDEAHYRAVFREWWTSALVRRMELLRSKADSYGHIIDLFLELGSG